MSRLNCHDVEQELWRYIDRELPASDVAAVSDHLHGCETCRKLYHQCAREANISRGVLCTAVMGSETSGRIVRAMRREGLFRRDGVATRPESPVRPVVGMRGPLALAAACLIVATVGLASWFLGARAPALLGEFRAAGRAGGVVSRADRPGAPLADFKSGTCLSGNVFVVPDEVELTLELRGSAGHGASLVVTGPAELAVDPTSTRRSFSAVLEKGLLKASVEPRHAADEPFVIRTPEAVARVVGTEFVVDVTREGVTRLEVSRGAVEFRARSSPVGQPAERVTPETGARVVRRGDLTPSLPEVDLGDSSAVSAIRSSSDRPSAGDSAREESTHEGRPAGGRTGPGTDPAAEAHRGDASPGDVPVSPDGPTLERRAPPDLDQVVNPGNDSD